MSSSYRSTRVKELPKVHRPTSSKPPDSQVDSVFLSRTSADAGGPQADRPDQLAGSSRDVALIRQAGAAEGIT